MKGLKNYFYLSLFALTFFFTFIYLCVRIYSLITSDYSWYEAILFTVFVFAELFIIIHSIGYFLNVYYVYKKDLTFNPALKIPEINTYPSVAILVASYKEPLDILHDTLVCFYNLSYPEKHLFFLDDTRYELPWDTPENKHHYCKSIEEMCQSLGVNLFRSKWHGAKAGKLNDFLKFLDGKPLEGSDLKLYGKEFTPESIKYLIIFDADMNPFPNFVEALVGLMEKNDRAAFIQTPQYYSNFEFNRVAHAAGLQQAVFYEYICEGKSLQGSMFCCGTNVIFRKEALLDVGGFDESSVTEDFAISLKLHKNGWKSLYVNKVMAFGMGPEDLGAFFKQQFRWARGTIGILRKLPGEMLLHFRKFSINQWWEYFLSSTHYLVGLVFFVMVLFPIAYLGFNVPSYLASPIIYIFAFTPYIVLTMSMFIMTFRKRKYQTKDILSVLLINAVTFPVFIKAAFTALIGIKSTFGITPKGQSNMLSLKSLAPQVLTAMACVAGISWGLMRLYYEREPFYALSLNVFWTFYNFMMISSFLYFNHSEVEY